jgi:hypothetical protein
VVPVGFGAKVHVAKMVFVFDGMAGAVSAIV